MQFGPTFLGLLVHASIVLAAAGGLTLIALLFRDVLKRSIW